MQVQTHVTGCSLLLLKILKAPKATPPWPLVNYEFSSDSHGKKEMYLHMSI